MRRVYYAREHGNCPELVKGTVTEAKPRRYPQAASDSEGTFPTDRSTLRRSCRSVLDLPQQMDDPEFLLDLREEFEERAAIMQYDGGLSRELAEASALGDVLRRILFQGLSSMN